MSLHRDCCDEDKSKLAQTHTSELTAACPVLLGVDCAPKSDTGFESLPASVHHADPESEQTHHSQATHLWREDTKTGWRPDPGKGVGM